MRRRPLPRAATLDQVVLYLCDPMSLPRIAVASQGSKCPKGTGRTHDRLSLEREWMRAPMDNHLQRAVGLSLKAHRQKSGLSQEAFATSIGVHRTYVGGLERGEHNLTLNSVERIAARLGIEPTTLLPPSRRVDDRPSAAKRAPVNRLARAELGLGLASRATPSSPRMSTAARARMIRETLGANLSRERERAGLTQAELASASGVPRDTISRIEGGKREPRFSTLDPLAIALGVHVNLLSALPGPAEAGEISAEAQPIEAFEGLANQLPS
jgi:transcriptional regulator with XRE-family HTH domain